jgi:type III secretion protein L
MSFIAVHQRAGLTLATDRLVLPPDDVPAFDSAQQLAEALAALLDGERHRIDAARRAAHAAGHAEGLAEGLGRAQQAGAEQLAETLGALACQAQSDRVALRDAAIELSLLIVRRIAANLSRPELLAALAQQAIDHLALEQSQQAGAASPLACVVRLHPGLLAAVKSRLAPCGSASVSIEWRADDTLAPLDCVVDTPHGRLLAGLEAQLERVRAVLAESSSAARSPSAQAVAG